MFPEVADWVSESPPALVTSGLQGQVVPGFRILRLSKVLGICAFLRKLEWQRDGGQGEAEPGETGEEGTGDLEGILLNIFGRSHSNRHL